MTGRERCPDCGLGAPNERRPTAFTRAASSGRAWKPRPPTGSRRPWDAETPQDRSAKKRPSSSVKDSALRGATTVKR